MTVADAELDAYHARRQALWDRYGIPTPYDTAKALRALGQRDKVHPVDSYAYLHETREAADAYAKADMEEHGHPTWILCLPDVGWVVVIDFRPCLLEHKVPLRDPQEPDK